MTKEELRKKSYAELTYMLRLIRDEITFRDSNTSTWSPSGGNYHAENTVSFTKRLMNRLKRKK